MPNDQNIREPLRIRVEEGCTALRVEVKLTTASRGVALSIRAHGVLTAARPGSDRSTKVWLRAS